MGLKRHRRAMIAGVVACVCILALPLIRGDRYALHVGVVSALNLMLVLGLFLVTGIAGQLNLGQAGLWAVGAYAYAILAKSGMPASVCFVASIAVPVAVGVLVGVPSLRVSGLSLAMVTLGFGEIVKLVLLNWREVTEGGMGIRGIPRPEIFGFRLVTQEGFYVVAVALAAGCLWLTRRLLRSNLGLAMKGTGCNEPVCRAVGVNTFGIKLASLAISSMFCGLAGAVYSSYFGLVHPEAFSPQASFSLVQMLVIGGVHSLGGVAVMTPILTLAFEYLRALGEYQIVAYSVLLIVFVIFCPQGLGGIVEGWVKARELRGREGMAYAARG